MGGRGLGYKSRAVPEMSVSAYMDSLRLSIPLDGDETSIYQWL